jgi:D-3-phosphoglycerate dehydrogenase
VDLPRVILPDPIHSDGIAKLREHFVVEVFSDREEETRLTAITRADAVIVRNVPISAELMDRCSRLKVISKHGAGVDNIDLDAASERGIAVTNVPGGNADAVAEGTVALMLATLRRVPEVHRQVAGGHYSVRWSLRYGQLTNRTLGLVGIGKIGTRVAAICSRGFRMRILACDPGLSRADIAARGAEKVENIGALLAEADVVSLHLPLTRETRHIIGCEQLRLMKRSAILVNTARGPLIDEMALCEALTTGAISGAGLDVLETEPPTARNPILSAPNVVLSPHTAGSTEEADRHLALAAAENAIAVLNGRRPKDLLNPASWQRRRR